MMDSNRCTNNDEVSLMNSSKSHGGVRRSRDSEVTTFDYGKRRKFDPSDQEKVDVVQLENQCRSTGGVDVNSPDDVVSSAESGSRDHVSSSPCLENDSSLDLKAELRLETETSMSSNDGFSRETSPSSEICLDSNEMESSSTLNKKTPPPPPTAASGRKPASTSSNPTAAEIEEFFSVAEKQEQKRFADKYNYDIVKDVPLGGRYQWVRLKP